MAFLSRSPITSLVTSLVSAYRGLDGPPFEGGVRLPSPKTLCRSRILIEEERPPGGDLGRLN